MAKTYPTVHAVSGLLVLCLALSGCPSPLSKAILLRVKDEISPTIVVVSLPDGSSYAATVVVTGFVTDSATMAGEGGGVQSLLYQVLATIIDGEAVVQPNGSFSFQFPTTTLSGPIIVLLTAKDWNGNQGSKSFTLVDEGAIPSFTATPGNHRVTLAWEPDSFGVEQRARDR